MSIPNPAVSLLMVLGISTPLIAQDADTARHFGFENMEVVPMGPGAGPIIADDLDADGYTDLIIPNNYKMDTMMITPRKRFHVLPPLHSIHRLLTLVKANQSFHSSKSGNH